MKQGLLGFAAEMLMENEPMLNLLEKRGYEIDKRSSEGVYELLVMFRS